MKYSASENVVWSKQGIIVKVFLFHAEILAWMLSLIILFSATNSLLCHIGYWAGHLKNRQCRIIPGSLWFKLWRHFVQIKPLELSPCADYRMIYQVDFFLKNFCCFIEIGFMEMQGPYSKTKKYSILDKIVRNIPVLSAKLSDKHNSIDDQSRFAPRFEGEEIYSKACCANCFVSILSKLSPIVRYCMTHLELKRY